MRNIPPGPEIPRPAERREHNALEFTSVPPVAELLLVSPETVRRWISDERLNSHKFGRLRRIAVVDLTSFIRRARRGGAPLCALNPFEDTFHTVENVADTLNCCVRTVRRRTDSGVLVAHDFFGIIRIAESDLRDFIERSGRD